MCCISQKIHTPSIKDLKSTIRQRLEEFRLKLYIDPGDSVALTASSRGIKNQALLLREIVIYLQKIGGDKCRSI